MSLDVSELQDKFGQLKSLGYERINYDALWKWSSILFLFDTIREKMVGNEIIEAGGGHSPISKILSEQYNVTNIDKDFNDRWFPEGIGLEIKESDSLHLIESDFIKHCKILPDNSIDVVIDGCSIIHFDTDTTNINKGLFESAKQIYRILKKDGYFIMATDVLYPDELKLKSSGEFLYPSDVVKCVEKSGMRLTDTLKINCERHVQLYKEKWGSNTYDKLYFGFPIQGWETRNGLRLTVIRTIYKKNEKNYCNNYY